MMVSAKKAGEIILRSGVLRDIEEYAGAFRDIYRREQIYGSCEFSYWKDVYTREVVSITITIGDDYWFFIKRKTWHLIEYRGENIDENLLKRIIEEIKKFCTKEIACRILEVL